MEMVRGIVRKSIVMPPGNLTLTGKILANVSVTFRDTLEGTTAYVTIHDALEGTFSPPDNTILASSLADADVALHEVVGKTW